MQRSLIYACLAEMIGTAVLVFFGVGSVHVAVLTGALHGLWQVAVVWGLGVGLAIYATAAISGAHLNPAVTAAFTAFRSFPIRRVPAYIMSQLLGAILAATLLYAMFAPALAAAEQQRNLPRGSEGSEALAMIYGEYFPNPQIIGTRPDDLAKVNHTTAFVAEALGTGLLVFFVFALTEGRNGIAPSDRAIAFPIGFTVAAIICIIAPLSQAGLNPARDLGPRLVAYAIGFGHIAIPGPRGGFLTVYILAPVIGGLIGGAAYHWLLRPGLAHTDSEASLPASPDGADTHVTDPLRTAAREANDLPG